MANTNSSRTTVRKSPQPKVHSYIPAVFTDDYGRDRALTVTSAKKFSRKKLDKSSRSLQQRGNREMDKAIAASDRETAKAVRRLRRQERETEIAIKRFFRRVIRTKVKIPEIKFRSSKRQRIILPSAWHAMPKYDGPIRDKLGRRGVFARFRYYSARTAKPGVSKRVTIYIVKGAAIDADGERMVRTNVGLTIEETVCGFDHLEQVNWSAQKGAKILNHAILAMDHRWTPEQMLEVAERWAEERFGQYDLPYCVALHEPPPEGDVRNWHCHVTWSWRPLERTGDHEWLVGEGLRTDLDGAEGMLVLRERFAAQMTEMSFQTGNRDIYTALSNIARGLPHEAQTHLGEARTRQVREGGFDAANEENHERVLRSKAAVVDDELRREDERLAAKQRIAQRVRDRFAKVLALPAMPAIASIASRIGVPLEAMKVRVLCMARPVDLPINDIPPEPRAAENPSFASWCRDWAERIRPQMAGIANLRFSRAASISPSSVPEAPSLPRVPSEMPAPATILRTVAIPTVGPVPAVYTWSTSKLGVPAKVEPLVNITPMPVPAPPAPVAVSITKIANLRDVQLLRRAAPIPVPTAPARPSAPSVTFAMPAVQTSRPTAIPRARVPVLPMEAPVASQLSIPKAIAISPPKPVSSVVIGAVPQMQAGPFSVARPSCPTTPVASTPLISGATISLIANRIAEATHALSDSSAKVDRRPEEDRATSVGGIAEKHQPSGAGAPIAERGGRNLSGEPIPPSVDRKDHPSSASGGPPPESYGASHPSTSRGPVGAHVTVEFPSSGTEADDDEAERVRQRAEETSAALRKQIANARMHDLLLATLISERHLVQQTKSGATVPSAVLRKLEITEEQLSNEVLQRKLCLLRYDQQVDIASIAAAVIGRPDRLKKVGDRWTIRSGGPPRSHSSTAELAEAWSTNPDVRKALAEFAQMKPASDPVEVRRRRSLFGRLVHGLGSPDSNPRAKGQTIEGRSAYPGNSQWPTDSGIT